MRSASHHWIATARYRRRVPDSACLFCRIVAGDVPAEIVHRDGGVVAFRDVNPQAPLHVLLVPVVHHPDIAAVAAAEPALVGAMTAAAAAIAGAAGHDDYRLVTNTGAGAGQSVFHAHVHLLAGRPMGWPPG